LKLADANKKSMTWFYSGGLMKSGFAKTKRTLQVLGY
jgi:hypothetical protein